MNKNPQSVYKSSFHIFTLQICTPSHIYINNPLHSTHYIKFHSVTKTKLQITTILFSPAIYLFINPLVKHVERFSQLVTRTGTEDPFHDRKNLFSVSKTLTRRERVKRTRGDCVSKTGSASNGIIGSSDIACTRI